MSATMNIQHAISQLVERDDLDSDDMQAVMLQVMQGECTDAQIGAFLVALHMKGETPAEVAAAARVMRQLATPVPVNGDECIDIVGTGGDASHTFNISTCSALVAAAGGAKVAKHGNRSLSSKSGAADFLEQAGVALDLDPEAIARCIEELNIGFMFAPMHHGAMKHAIGPRRELGIRTVFNLLGPLTNPAKVQRMVLGVFSEQWLRPMAEALQALGLKHALVVHGASGMDEFSLAGASQVIELIHGELNEFDVRPENFGLEYAPLSAVQVSSPEQSQSVIKEVLEGKAGAPRDIVCLNAAAALLVAGRCDHLSGGVELARQTIDSGAAREKLQALAALSQQLSLGANA